jgi:hypothetical protein
MARLPLHRIPPLLSATLLAPLLAFGQAIPQPASAAPPGYAYGTAAAAKSPLSDAEFELLKKTVLFGEDDVKALRLAGEVLDDQIEAVLDVWYGYVGAHPHLAAYFGGVGGAPSAHYLAAVRKRFGQWIRDTTAANYDRAWLDYQYEIGLRHTRAKKNRTDAVPSSADVVHLRYLVAFVVPITATVKPFLAKKGHSAADVERMHQAWFKAVTLTVVLWSQPYLPKQDF